MNIERLMEQKDHELFMRRAIELGSKGAFIENSGGPFGAVVVKDGVIIGEGYYQVVKRNDPTWHAEIQAIREATKKLGSPHLNDCILYASGECCPMCLAAAHWANIAEIYYASTVGDALKYGNFRDEDILNEIKKEPRNRRIKMIELLRKEALEVWEKFAQLSDE